VHRTDTIIVGSGQAGLAVSSLLTQAGRDHVVLERGRVAESWRSERWDSLRLLSPNWMTRLPGWRYRGDDPDGFMHRDAVIDFLDRYSVSFGAPVQGETTVQRVHATPDGYRVVTDQGTWQACNVVIATGANGRAHVPAIASDLDRNIFQITPSRYRSPAKLPDGGVLVVGASASGAQLAHELAGAGRRVVLAVGEHSRGIRRYRGRDIFRWLEDTGKNDTPRELLGDRDTAPLQPSVQLVGGHPPVNVDLPSLQARGVVLTGRLTGASGTRLEFADDLAVTSASADARFRRLLQDFDEYAADHGLTDLEAATPVDGVELPTRPITRLDLRGEGISNIVWATGFRPDFSWLDVPVLDGRSAIRQEHGATPAPGLYVVGLRFQTRRNSNFIDGVRHDAREVVDHIVHGTDAVLRVAV
jgi:putative flavoprotein involved in K+ transport